MKAFLVEGFQLFGVAADAVDLHRTLGTDADDFAPVLHALDKGQLLVVGLHMMAQDYPQAGVLLVEKARHLDVGLAGTEATIAGHDDDIGRKALVDGSYHRNGVDDATVKHRDAVNLGNLCHVGQRGGSLGDGCQPTGIVLLRQVLGTARQTVGTDHLERGGIAPIGIVVEGHYLVGEALVKDVGVEDGALGEQTFQRDVAVLAQHVDVGITGTARLAAHVGQSVTGSCRHGHDVREIELVLHERIEDARGEHPAHAPSFEHQSCMST